MSESPVDHGTSEDRVHLPAWRTIINLVIAVLTAALAPFFVCLLLIPLVLVLAALTYYAPPGFLQGLSLAAELTSIAAYFGGGVMTLCAGTGFVIFGIPTAILGWRLGRITLRSSILAGFLIGCLPRLLILPIDQSFGPNYPSTANEILRVAGEILATGMLGAFEGFLFWIVWRFLSRYSVPPMSSTV